MKYFVGVDGGGTKTEAIILDSNGHEIFRCSGASTNPHAVGYDCAKENMMIVLNTIFNGVNLAKDSDVHICLGIAGVYKEEEKEIFADYLRLYAGSTKFHVNYVLKSDVEIALIAAFGKPCGVIAISGTGSVTYGITSAGKAYRVGGWGHILGDEGSGYSIGLCTLQSVMRSFDGVYPETALTSMIMSRCGIMKVDDLKGYVYSGNLQKQDIAEFARITIKASENGDRIARKIILQAAYELAQSAIALIGKDEYFRKSKVAVSGSIFLSSDLFFSSFVEKVGVIFKEVHVARINQPPAYGAARFLYSMENQKL